MPTVGWIYEDSVERFLADTTQVPGPLGPPKPSFRCPFCVGSFKTPIELGEHLGDAHTGARPIFIYNGAEPKSQDTMRTLARARDLAFLNCTSVFLGVNGAAPKLCNVGEAAAALRRSSGRVRVSLENQFERGAAPIRQSYDLEFRVPSADELQLADRNFISSLAREDPRVADVDDFLQRAKYGGASEYANALADYVLGVLLKDGDPASGVRPSTRDYRPKLNNALRVLQSFDRPLARLICAFISFSSNGFPHATVPTGYPELDRASALLNRLAAPGVQTKLPTSPESNGRSGSRIAVCPVDNGTTGVLRRATQALDAVRWTSLDEDEFRAEASLPALDPLDRVKLYVLWAYGAIRLGKPASAVEPLRELVGDHCFGRWAEAALEEYDS
jgi:hypothetical protein